MPIKTGYPTSFIIVIFFVLTWWIINEFENVISNNWYWLPFVSYKSAIEALFPFIAHWTRFCCAYNIGTSSKPLRQQQQQRERQPRSQGTLSTSRSRESTLGTRLQQ